MWLVKKIIPICHKRAIYYTSLFCYNLLSENTDNLGKQWIRFDDNLVQELHIHKQTHNIYICIKHLL